MIVSLNESILYNGVMYHPDSQGLCEVADEVAIALGLTPSPTTESKPEQSEEEQQSPTSGKRRRTTTTIVEEQGEGKNATDEP